MAKIFQQKSLKLSETREIQLTFANFIDKYFLVISEYNKFGPFIYIKNQKYSINGITSRPVFEISTLFGSVSELQEVTARFLVEQLKLFDKPVLITVLLKDYFPETLKSIVKEFLSTKS